VDGQGCGLYAAARPARSARAAAVAERDGGVSSQSPCRARAVIEEGHSLGPSKGVGAQKTMRRWFSRAVSSASGGGNELGVGGGGNDDELEHLENGLGYNHADVEEWVRRQAPASYADPHGNGHGHLAGDMFESAKRDPAAALAAGHSRKSKAATSIFRKMFSPGKGSAAEDTVSGGGRAGKGRQGRGGNGEGGGVQARHSKTEIQQMAKYLGIEAKDKQFYWIAQEALEASLPPEWQEFKTEDGNVYYYSSLTKESSWEHPLDGYFRFLYRKLRRMKKYNKNGKGKDTPEQARRDRELVDVLWHMEQEQKKAQLLKGTAGAGAGGGSGGSDSGSRSGSSVSRRTSGSSLSHSFYDSHSALDSSLEEGSLGRSNSQASSSRASSRTASCNGDSHSMGAYISMVSQDSVPAEVKEIANYLGINLSALDTPVSIDEVREMAEYLGIDVKNEGYLLPLSRMALQVLASRSLL
jgi:hypothetical protein